MIIFIKLPYKTIFFQLLIFMELKENKADPRQYNTITRTQFIMQLSRSITIDPSIGSYLGGGGFSQ